MHGQGDEVIYMEFNDFGEQGGMQLRRNRAWEFLHTAGVGDLVSVKSVRSFGRASGLRSQSLVSLERLPHVWVFHVGS